MKNTSHSTPSISDAAPLMPVEQAPALLHDVPGGGVASAMVTAPASPQAADRPVEVEIPPAVAAISAAEAMTLALSPPQQTAIRLLTSGHTLVSAATAAGVNRTTLYRWLKADSAFLAAFNAWQKDVLDTARGRILALSDLAISTVARAMTSGDAKTAMGILKSIGALDRPAPGSTDADEIQRMQKLERTRAQTSLRKAEARAEMESYEPL